MASSAIIVGGGAVGTDFHLPRILGIVGCPEVTVVDNSEFQCERLRKRFARNSRIRISRHIPDQTYELAVVATPPKYHFDSFMALKDLCKHIIVEKPITKTLEEAIELNRMAGEMGISVYVGLIRRGLRNFPLLKTWIDSNFFGALRGVRVAEGSIFSWNAVSGGSFSRDLNGGGVLMDTGPHTLDQLFQLFESLEVVSAEMDALPAEGTRAIEANATIELRCSMDRPITLCLSRNRALSNTARFDFERADVELGLHCNSIRILDKTGVGVHGLPEGLEADVDYQGMFNTYYRKFIAPRDNRGISGSESTRLQELMAEIYRRAKPMSGHF